MIQFLASANPESVRFAIDLMVILASSALLAAAFQRFRLESIPGFLIAGILVGPHVFGIVQDSPRIEQISEIAIILLMFGIGLHLDMASIRRGMVSMLAIGVVSTLAFVGVAWVVLRLLGTPAAPALLLAMAGSISSTAVFVRVVTARKELRAIHGRVGLGISIAQDIITVAMLAMVPVVSRAVTGAAVTSGGAAGGLPNWVEFLAAAAKGLGGVTVMLAAGHYVLPRLLHLVVKAGSGELMLVVSASVALMAAVGTKVLGFSPEMGALLAGLLLASTPYRYQLSGMLAPLRDLLMAIFFTSVGLAVDPQLLLSHAGTIIAAVIGVMAVKTVLITLTTWAAGASAPASLLTGVYLGNAGEFTIVILGASAAAGGLNATQESLGVTVVIISLIASSLVIAPAHRLVPRTKSLPLSKLFRVKGLTDAPAPDGHHTEIAGHAIIAGFGPVGRALADRFDILGISYVVVELNTTTVERQAARGRMVVYGDITNPEVLESAGVHRADAVILTFPDDAAMLRACEAVRALAPTAFIAARTNYLSGSFRAQQLGADHVTVEEIATARAMEKEVLAKIQQRIDDRVRAQAERARAEEATGHASSEPA